jgi:hypothetical protein
MSRDIPYPQIAPALSGQSGLHLKCHLSEFNPIVCYHAARFVADNPAVARRYGGLAQEQASPVFL